MQRIEVSESFHQPVERVFAFLAEHENLGPLLGARVTRVRDGQTSRNGVGSTRSLKVGPLPALEETVTQVVPDELIEYRITKGGAPVSDHLGVLRFAARGAGSTLTWTITFSAPPVLAQLVTLGLTRSIKAGLKKVDARA